MQRQPSFAHLVHRSLDAHRRRLLLQQKLLGILQRLGAHTTGHELQPVRQRPDQAETPRAVRLAAPDLAAAPATAAAPLAAAIPRVAGNRRAHVVTTAAAARPRPRRTGTEAAAPAAAGTTAAAAGTIAACFHFAVPAAPQTPRPRTNTNGRV